MAAYVVIARIDRVAPHVAGWGPATVPCEPVAEVLEEPEAVDLVGRPPGAILAERWASIRETWAQTTFYLFDANSWR
jgi:hypothetical protein